MKGITILYTILLLTATKSVFSQNQTITVNSPDKGLALIVFTANKKLVYSVKAGNTSIINTSPLGLLADSIDLGDNIRITGQAVFSKINETYPIIGNHTKAINRANEAEIPFSASGKQMSLFVRVYDDGIAIRYTVPAGIKHIDGERTGWILPNNVAKIAWANYSQSYEGFNY